MRRRPRIDLQSSHQDKRDAPVVQAARGEDRLERKRKRWALVNKNRPPDENPFLAAIKPDHDNYGDPGETAEELRVRLDSLEFGNYPGYFNYRNKAAATTSSDNKGSNPAESAPRDGDRSETNNLELGSSDHRLTLMREEWFKDKNVLDIGCNRGHITYAIAKAFSPKFVLGIDIDLKMIHMANRDLHLHLEQDLLPSNLEFRIKRAYKLSESAEGDPNNGRDGAHPEGHYTEDERHLTISSYIGRGPLAEDVPRSRDQARCDNTESEANVGANQLGEHESGTSAAFPNNLLFVEHNYVLSSDELVARQRPFFDTIICLSVTKWIHLNYRDAGLKRFFKRIYNHLNEGGLLILEVQPFDNYHRKKKLSDRLRCNFNSISFKPEQFDEFLLSEHVGFRRVLFSTTTSHECAGFKRPMKVFLK